LFIETDALRSNCMDYHVLMITCFSVLGFRFAGEADQSDSCHQLNKSEIFTRV